MTIIITLAVAALQAAAGQAAQPQPQYPPATIALVTTYADGGSRKDLVSPKPAWWWQPNVPRVPSWTPPEGTTPFRALKIARRLVGNDVEVAVSLVRGPLMSDEQPIRVLTLSNGSSVTVAELLRFGFQPVVLSLAPAVPMTPFLPSIVSVSPEIEISQVDTLSAPYPGYRVRLRNLSSKTVATLHVRSYGRPDTSMSTVKAGEHGRPAMAPGGEYTFDVNLTSAAWLGDGSVSATPLDLIEIDAIVWADGTSTGSLSNPAAIAIPSDAGQRLVLERALEILRTSLAGSWNGQELVDRIRSGFSALSIDADRLPATRNAMRATLGTVTTDLSRFENRGFAAHDEKTVRAWIAHTIARYEEWIKRLSPV